MEVRVSYSFMQSQQFLSQPIAMKQFKEFVSQISNKSLCYSSLANNEFIITMKRCTLVPQYYTREIKKNEKKS